MGGRGSEGRVESENQDRAILGQQENWKTGCLVTVFLSDWKNLPDSLKNIIGGGGENKKNKREEMWAENVRDGW